MSNARDRAAGVLIGLAAGDRNGGPVRMAVRLAESLLENDSFELDDVAARYLTWWREGAFDTGPTAAEVLSLVDSGASFDEASLHVHRQSREHTAGCNPSHRSAPLALLSEPWSNQLADVAKREAALTHRHPLAGDVAAAVVLTCRKLVEGASWPSAIEAASDERLPKTRSAMSESNAWSINAGGFAPNVLAAAVHFIGNYASFERALNASIRFAGPANYAPVLVGCMGGAIWGASNIRPELLEHCDILPRITKAATRLAAKWK